MTNKIFAVDDDRDILQLIETVLQRENYNVNTYTLGVPALKDIRKEHPDALILDLNLPDINGMDILRAVKNDPPLAEIPVIIISGMAKAEDEGFESGAVHFIPKPFQVHSLSCRVRSVLNRAGKITHCNIFEINGLRLDAEAHEVFLDGESIHLAPMLFNLLQHFMEKPKHVFSKEVLQMKVWGYSRPLSTKTVETYIGRLRKKLNSKSAMIETLPCAGYRLNPQALEEVPERTLP